MLDRKMRYFEPEAMGTVLYGLFEPDTGELTVSSAGHLPPVLAVPGGLRGGPADPDAALVSVSPDLPIGAAEDAPRRSSVFSMPAGGLLCCFTDGLVMRPGHAGRRARDVTLAEDASAAVMRAMVGNAPARDDVAVLMLHRVN
jgi:serine phosphatase RsbU (regulator of sigma subunit)